MLLEACEAGELVAVLDDSVSTVSLVYLDYSLIGLKEKTDVPIIDDWRVFELCSFFWR